MRVLELETQSLGTPYDYSFRVVIERGWWFWRRRRWVVGVGKFGQVAGAPTPDWRFWIAHAFYEGTAAERVPWWLARSLERRTEAFALMLSTRSIRWKHTPEPTQTPSTF